ncbi:hypothetical protein B0T19DRAFT_24169 [Cercophora scortea]|uniref:Uncharacterized protein n=1 Tax=Cercophora scortea TaxID=314031 RepID=A0AAE0J3N7_9PEZI|nr:hypothetical protein B0T19DRAFT_24169 [Cercophora scortea]
MNMENISHDLRNPAMTSTIDMLRGTEKLVPPLSMAISIPPFERHHIPNHGERTLLLFPTENEGKVQILLRGFNKQQPPGSTDPLLYRTVPVESNVGEQPYNEAGVEGARNRISNGLRKFLATPEQQSYLEANKIGTVMVACIENFIQTVGVDRPTDFGVVVILNASTGEAVAAISKGVTVAPEYVEHARSLGVQDGNVDHGLVTVGNVLAANVPGLDKADWHAVVAGRSRYDILDEAIDGLRVPW